MGPGGSKAGVQALSLFTKGSHYSVILSANFCGHKAGWPPEGNELRAFLLFLVQSRDFSSFPFLSPSGELISSEQPLLFGAYFQLPLSSMSIFNPDTSLFTTSHSCLPFPLFGTSPMWMSGRFPHGNCSVAISFCFMNMTFY